MLRNNLLNLIVRNKGRGAGPRAAVGNTIYLYDVVVDSIDDEAWLGGVSAERIVRDLAAMQGPVTLRINSPGGSVFGGRAIAQAVRSHADGVHVIVDGLCASAVTYAATSAGQVSMAPGAFMMVHYAWHGIIGNRDRFRAEADILEKIDDSIAESYAARSGKPVDEFMAMMQAETWLTAAEAVALGLADEALPEVTGAKPVTNQWDVSMFDAAPEALKAEDEDGGTPVLRDEPSTSSVSPQDERVLVGDEPVAAASTDDEIAARQRKLAVALL